MMFVYGSKVRIVELLEASSNVPLELFKYRRDPKLIELKLMVASKA